MFNYGHSFGHAIESASNFSVPHGIAVSWNGFGNLISTHTGLIDMALRNELRDILALVWQGTSLTSVNIQRFLNALKRDKNEH